MSHAHDSLPAYVSPPSYDLLQKRDRVYKQSTLFMCIPRVVTKQTALGSDLMKLRLLSLRVLTVSRFKDGSHDAECMAFTYDNERPCSYVAKESYSVQLVNLLRHIASIQGG